MNRYYRVTFDTQRDRQYISWEYYTIANNQKEARQRAEQAWHSPNNGWYRGAKNKPHMFHIRAERCEEKDAVVQGNFHIERSRYAKRG